LASETKFKETEIGMIPEDWELLTLEKAMESIIDYRGKTPKKTDSGIPLITAKLVKNGRILEPNEFTSPEDYESWMRRGLPKSDDVVITTEAPMGEVAQLDERKVALAQRLITLREKREHCTIIF
jgi:type I restriction enzyme S subunit